ncbi:ImmA/IrrE family metallo-endopeptidase [Sediminibacillus massiliensis]|uniref:ImmA/IrrE family metallo-endopeptidase n=1 Tax=Sediminibacillus massiliensis TaxID=1926277 RepID=UPI00098834E4|nr:ImmA/IrrE family metallo-endopeptidase [Sediminibacillus massiliensis]
MTPKAVQIAGVKYQIVESKDLMIDSEVYGQVTYHNNRILIDGSLEVQRKESVFVHEMFHAIMFEAGYDEQDEDMVRRVSNVLYQVLKDNNFEFEADTAEG